MCVYCASSIGTDPRFADAADELGSMPARSGVRLVYGGGRVGLMGRVADAALAGGGEVHGVIPKGLLSEEVARTGVTQLFEVGSMHDRKQLTFELADAFVAVPGGWGTLEELAEITTWAQLGIHAKPIVLVDVQGFWSRLVALLDDMVNAGFLKPRNREFVGDPVPVDAVPDTIAKYRPCPAEVVLGPDGVTTPCASAYKPLQIRNVPDAFLPTASSTRRS